MSQPDLGPKVLPLTFCFAVGEFVKSKYSTGKQPKGEGRKDAVTLIVGELASFHYNSLFERERGERRWNHEEALLAEHALMQAVTGKGKERWNGVRDYVRRRAESSWDLADDRGIPPRFEFWRYRGIPQYQDALALTYLMDSI